MYTTIPDTTAFPWSSIVRIVTYYEDGFGAVGSGVVVGPNDVLTAAHVVSDPGHGAPVSIQVAPGVTQGQAPFGVFEAARADHFPVDQDGDRFVYASESASDLAVLGFTQPIADITGSMGMDPDFTEGIVAVGGYPATGSSPTLVESAGEVDPLAPGVLDIRDLGVAPGFSGGPVWHDTGYGPEVVGVTSTGIGAADLGNGYYDTVLAWIAGNDDLLAPVAVAGTGGEFGWA